MTHEQQYRFSDFIFITVLLNSFYVDFFQIN